MERDKITLMSTPCVAPQFTIELLDPIPGTRVRVGDRVLTVMRGGCGACPEGYALMYRPPACEEVDRSDHGFYLRDWR